MNFFIAGIWYIWFLRLCERVKRDHVTKILALQDIVHVCLFLKGSIKKKIMVRSLILCLQSVCIIVVKEK